MSTTVVSNHPALNGEVTKSLPVLPTISIPPPKPVAQHGLLINAITSGKSAVTVDGVHVKKLAVKSASPDDPTGPGEFVAQGTINLFGNKNIVAEFDIWHGPPPQGVTIGSASPSIQRAIIKGPVKLSQLVPSLGANLTLQNLSVYHQNYLYDPTKDLGYDLDADLVIDSSLGSLSSMLSKILGVSDPTVHIHANFGPDQSWNGSPNVNALTLEGSLVGRTYAASPGVQITSIGVRLILSHSPNNPTTSDIEVFGTLNLTLPAGGVLPLTLDYTLRDHSGTVKLTASLPSGVTWVNPMGVPGFVLNPVTFSSSLPLSDPWKGLTLDIAAQFQYQTTIVNFTGSYAPGGPCSLNANVHGFDLASLQQLYQAIHNEPLKTPDVDVTIESANLTIDSTKGFSATLTNVSVAGYGSGNAAFSFSSSGSLIRADLGTVHFGEVVVNSAYIQLDLQLASSSQSSSALIHGDIKFEALETDVAVHLYRSAPDVTPKRTEWTVYAELTSSDNSLALSRVEPKLKGTSFDLALKQAVFVAASRDDPDVGTFITGAYKPREGIQVFATFDEIPVFSSLAKSNVTGMVLDASWSTTLGFRLDVLLPVARNLSLGKGITTTPVTLSLALTPNPVVKTELIPALMVSAGLNIPVAHSPEPLLFQMILTASATDATIAAELKGNWVDPFGISDEVVVGPDLLLQADFDYLTGLAGIAFRGGLAIGNTTAAIAVSVNEDPDKEMLYAEIDNLNFSDVVSFAERLLHLKLPPPPSDFLDFEKVKLYVCPAGLIIQGVVYPQGFSFESDMILFGKSIKASCAASDTLLSINGSVQDFDVGPLKLSGLDGAKEAVLQVKVGKDLQHVLVDGAVTLFAETYALHLLVDTQPSPEVSFKVEFKFTELLTFEVDATLIGALDLKNLSKADFSFHADLEQHILDYIHDELLKAIATAKAAAENGIEVAKQRVSQEQATLDHGIAQAKAQLWAAQAKWEAHQKTVTAPNAKIIDDYNAKIQDLQGAVERAKQTYNAAFQSASAKLTDAQHDRAVKMQAAQNALEQAKGNAAADVANAKGKVAAAQGDMNRDFGVAEGNVEGAKRSVDSLNGKIADIDRQIDGLQHESWIVRHAKAAGLEIEKAGVEVALKTAQGVLDAAQAILRTSNFVAEKTALDAAQKTLDLAQQAAPVLISDSQAALDAVDKVTQAAVDRAAEALKAVQSGGEKIAFDGAVATLEAYKRVNDALFDAATKALADLIRSAEYLAFAAATTALATAQSATKALNAANDILSAAETGSAELLDAASKIVSAGTQALNLTSVHLSGSLGKSVGGAGFQADAKGVFLSKPFAFSVELNPSKVENYFKDMLQQLVDHVKKDLHL